MEKCKESQIGLSLVELLMAMVISGIIISVVVNIFYNNQKVITAIDESEKMRTNTRGAVFAVEDSIRMAGFSPSGEISPTTAIVKASQGAFSFRKIKDSGTGVDSISIALNRTGDCGSSSCKNQDGIAMSGSTSLVVNSQNAADNISAIRFYYGFDDNEDGFLDCENNNIKWAVDTNDDGFLDRLLDSNFDGKIDLNDSPLKMNPGVQISKIRAVKVLILSRTRFPSGKNNQSFILGCTKNGSEIFEYLPDDNNYKYLLFSTIVRCRNLGG